VVWDLLNDARVGRRTAESFPLQSVVKLGIALAVYDAADRGVLELERPVALEQRDLVFGASRIADDWQRGARGPYRAGALIDRMLIESDNTAADVLYRLVHGKATINAVLARKGITGINVRTNEAGVRADGLAGRTFAKGGDNAGTPDAVASLLAKLQIGTLVSNRSRTRFMNALSASRTGPGRLRAGLPPATPLAHKTGTSGTRDGATDATNDAGIVLINGYGVVIVAFLNGARGSNRDRDAAIAGLARDVYAITRSALALRENHVALGRVRHRNACSSCTARRAHRRPDVPSARVERIEWHLDGVDRLRNLAGHHTSRRYVSLPRLQSIEPGGLGWRN
ncbi:MAG: serine hydrolase, partial [Candidatus Eremiobacteraeota bacterium]|nr:serine hydrolase [Candidatus Eremiobacteraeota bacterium]